MRQVPATYLIIGRGRLASHLAHYFTLLHIPFSMWSREDSPAALAPLVASARAILLAIKDDSIAPFISEHQLPAERTIHFSGALNVSGAVRLHPLMTFSKSLYLLEDYQKVSFVGEQGAPTLQDMIPELPNPYFAIPKNTQDLYHALCVLAGPGTQVLWQETLQLFADRFLLPASAVMPYLERVFKNFASDPQNSLTGPWVRNDVATIEKNQRSLSHHALAPVYSSLLSNYMSRPVQETALNTPRSLV